MAKKKRPEPSSPGGDPVRPLVQRHLHFGWWALTVFVSLGTVLELLHGFKVGFYLDLANETRRMLWTLAHAHGTLLSLVNLAFAGTVRLLAPEDPAPLEIPSRLLRVAAILLPAGFFLGGVVVYGGDPNPAILLVPLGAAALLVAVVLVALRVDRDTRSRK